MTPGDPRCPHCDGAISATSSYCMHCGKDIESTAGSGGEHEDPGESDEFEQASAYEPPSSRNDDNSGWLDPDGVLDNVSTVAVAGVTAVLVAVVGFVVVLLVSRSLLASLLGPLAAIGVGVWVANNRSVFGALRKACYATATTLALVPTIALGPSMEGGTFAGQIILFLAAAVVVGIPALLLVGVGYAAGKRRPESVRG